MNTGESFLGRLNIGSHSVFAILVVLFGLFTTPVYAIPPLIAPAIEAQSPDHQPVPVVRVYFIACDSQGPQATFLVFRATSSRSAWRIQYAYCGGDPVNRWDPSGLDYIDFDNGKYYWVVEKSGSLYDPDVQRIEIGGSGAIDGDVWVKSMGYVTDKDKLNHFAKQFYIGDESDNPMMREAMVWSLLAHVKRNPQVMPEYSEARLRLWGVAQAAGGAAESAGGAALIATPEPTMATKVGGGILLVHGADNFAAGTVTAWRGRPQLTFNEMAVVWGLTSAGVNPQTSREVAGYTNAAIGLGAGVTAARGMIGRPVMLSPGAAGAPGQRWLLAGNDDVKVRMVRNPQTTKVGTQEVETYYGVVNRRTGVVDLSGGGGHDIPFALGGHAAADVGGINVFRAGGKLYWNTFSGTFGEIGTEAIPYVNRALQQQFGGVVEYVEDWATIIAKIKGGG